MPRSRGLTFESFSRNVNTWVWGFGSPDDGSGSDVPYGPTCVICNEEYQAGSIVCKIQTCDHTFHHQCITQWWARSTRCPICNNNLGAANRFRVSSERSFGSTSLSLSRSSSNADSIRSGLVLVGYSNSDPQLIHRSRSYYDIHSILGMEDMERLRENILARNPIATPLRESRSESSLPRLPYGPAELLSSSPSWNMLPLDDRLQPVEELADEIQASARELDSIRETYEIHDAQHSARRTPSLPAGPTSPKPGSAVPSGSVSHVETPLTSAVGVAHMASLVAINTTKESEGAPEGPIALAAGHAALQDRLDLLPRVPDARGEGTPHADRAERSSACGLEAKVDEVESTAQPVSTISPRGGPLVNEVGLQHKQYPQAAAPIERTFFCSLSSFNATNRIVPAISSFRITVPLANPLRPPRARIGDPRYVNDIFSASHAPAMDSRDATTTSHAMGLSGDMSAPIPGVPPPVRRGTNTAVSAPFGVGGAQSPPELGDYAAGYMTPLCVHEPGSVSGEIHQGANPGIVPRHEVGGPKENAPRARVGILPTQNVHAGVSGRPQIHGPMSAFRQNTCGEFNIPTSGMTLVTASGIRAMPRDTSVPAPSPSIFRVRPPSTSQNNHAGMMHNGGMQIGITQNGGVYNDGMRRGTNEQRTEDARAPVPPAGEDFNHTVRQQNELPEAHENCASRLNGASHSATLQANSNAVLAPMIRPAALLAPHFYSGRQTLPGTMAVPS